MCDFISIFIHRDAAELPLVPEGLKLPKNCRVYR